MLTQQEINEFRNELNGQFRAVREDIRQALLRSDEQRYIDLAGQVADLENSSVADLLVDVSLADIDRHVQEIRDIDAALLRIADNSFGICSDCEQAIDRARLQVYPTAKRCLACQTRYENRFARPHSRSL